MTEGPVKPSAEAPLDARVAVAAMQEIADLVSQFPEIEEVSQRVLAALRTHAGVQRAVLYITDLETGDLMLRVGEEPAGRPKPDLNLPLKARDVTVGTLKVWAGPERPATLSEQLVQFAAGQLAMAAEQWQLRALFEETSRALTEASHFGSGVANGLADGLVTTDTLGTVTFVNRAAEELAGRPRRSLIGRPLAQAIPSADDWLAWMATDTLITGRLASPREVYLILPDETSVPVEVRMSVLQGDDRDQRGVLLLLKDLREQKALQQEKRRLDRLTAMGQMSAVVAHEFRSPLTGIKLGVQYLSQHVDPDGPMAHAISVIAEEVEQMARKVDDILLVSRRLELKPQPCDPVELVEHTLSKWTERLHEAGIQVRREFAEGVPLVRADAMRMEQVFTNLIRNAVDAMPEGGILTVSVAYGQGPRGGHGPSGGEVVMAVRDTGEGIPLVALDRIFEPFYTTKSKGAGLGLAIVYSIVREHGGEVKAANAPDRGAEFVITLPALAQERSPWQQLSS